MMRLAIQLYTFRTLDEPLERTLERLADTPFEGVEFAGLGGSTPADVATTLDETGLEPAGAHVRADTIEADYEATVETYRTLGVERLVVPTYDRSAFESVDGVDEAAERLAGLADRLADDGFELLYHNHRFEFGPLGNSTAFVRFVDRLDGAVKLEIDVGLAESASVDPVGLLRSYGEECPLVHLTDTVPGSDDSQHVDLGTGVVDIRACVQAARTIDADWIVFEHGQTTDPIRSADDAAQVLTDALPHR